MDSDSDLKPSVFGSMSLDSLGTFAANEEKKEFFNQISINKYEEPVMKIFVSLKGKRLTLCSPKLTAKMPLIL